MLSRARRHEAVYWDRLIPPAGSQNRIRGSLPFPFFQVCQKAEKGQRLTSACQEPLPTSR
jgi:hypothetical protein